MNQDLENRLISDWASLIDLISSKRQWVAIGIFNIEGQLLDANLTMCYFLNTDVIELKPKNFFINPEYSKLFNSNLQDKVFEGMITIGNYVDGSYVLNSKVYRRGSHILVYGEIDVAHLFEENRKMSTLNQSVNNLQRQLIKEKKNLQNTLAELKETQQMLIHSEKMNAMGQLVAGVAHELNNPIAFVYSNLFSIESYIQTVFQSYKEVERLIKLNASEELNQQVASLSIKNNLDFLLEDLADMAKESKLGIERVKLIIEDLRRFSRLDESEIKQIDLIENIKSTITIIRSEISKKNINFEFLTSSYIQLNCYPGQLNQAILNVLINAIYAVDIGGHIVLSVTEGTNNVCISIRDNGSGISKDVIEHIFDPFYTTKPIGSGTGLGLSITYKIIYDLHHGYIEVNSELEKGTSFKLIIPRNILQNENRSSL